MNERIEQLMNQASHGACYDGPLDVNLTGNEIEKFAQLIVRDCVDILAGYRGQLTWKNEEVGHQHPISVIQKHFGVES